jgi:hypothetical protein|tara:strand:- start:6253 stop:6483 length:231 start_codon:yes stop_codon:yes gene_type:complete
MDIIKNIGQWAGALAESGMFVIALGIVLQVLFAGVSIPFVGNINVIDNIMGILGGLSNEGLLGLVGAFIIYHLLKK